MVHEIQPGDRQTDGQWSLSNRDPITKTPLSVFILWIQNPKKLMQGDREIEKSTLKSSGFMRKTERDTESVPPPPKMQVLQILKYIHNLLMYRILMCPDQLPPAAVPAAARSQTRECL
ncbi:hypothetical protein EVAR_103200_1 [Eumeta japonica]|uniref:Uncharacterized protein n=1 Tax=Eumeta variegata TaxID=151549 RepID=A0A4C1YH26_EUMVA|nr:hypothetical protein EVAR_103200_1 [Eumeta japonica]